MNLRKPILILSLLVVLGAVGTWIFVTRLSTQETAPPPTVAVSTATIESTVLATGLIEARHLVSVGARTSGLIEALNVAVGDEVAQGDVIARIDSLEQQNAVAQAKADLAQNEAEIASKTAEIKQGELELTRQQGLNAKKLSATSDLEAAQASLAMSQADLQSLMAQKSRAEIEVAAAELDLERTNITAPIDGTVVAVVNDEGTTVNASQEAPTIVKLAQLSQMEVKAEISEADVVHVAPGQTVRFALLGDPDHSYEAVLDSVEPAPSSIKESDEIDTDTAIYYNARFMVDNPDRLLRIGMSADVTIILGRAPDVPSLPLSVLPQKSADGSYYVRVLGDDGLAHRQQIRIGLKDATRFEITEGLQAGARVLTSTPARSSGASSPSQGRGRPMMGF